LRRAVSGVTRALLLFGMLTLASNIQKTISTFENLDMSPSTKNSALSSLYENVTTNNGDLIINGTQTYVIENCSYTQTGNIEVRDYGTLIIRNSFFQARAIYVYDDGDVTMNESQMSSPFYVGFQDYSHAHINNSSFTNCQVWFGSRVPYNGYPQGEIRNTTISSLDINSNASVSVFDSYIDYFWFGIVNGSIGVDGLEPGFFSSWNSYENCSALYGVPNVTLSATSIDNWTLAALGSQLYVNKSILASLILWPNCTTLVQYSTIGGLHPIYGFSNITIDSSHVSHLYAYRFTGCILFSNATGLSPWGTLIEESHFYVLGNITTSENSPLYIKYWSSSSVTRNYDAIFQDSKGQPIPNAGLLIKSKDQSLVWNGTTDSLGRANFNLTFTDINYTDAFRLEAVKGELFAAQNVTFLSDTPVIIEMRTIFQGDINRDFTVDIYDAIMLALAYNSKPASQNWNTNADINGDNTIDIYDAILLANNYGKTA